MDYELLTGWLSVDPMMDKYPGISPYAYCEWNPIKYIDPNGLEKIISYNIKSANPEKRKEDEALTQAANRYTRNKGVIHLFAHGWVPEGQDRCLGINTYDNDGKVTRLKNAQALHEFLKGKSDIYDRNNPEGEKSATSILVMHSCQTGEAGAIAQEASRELNLLVIAPSENVTVKTDQYHDGRIEDTEYVSNNGVWNIYYKGELMVCFNGNTKPLFDNPEKTIEKYENMYKARHSQPSGE